MTLNFKVLILYLQKGAPIFTGFGFNNYLIKAACAVKIGLLKVESPVACIA